MMSFNPGAGQVFLVNVQPANQLNLDVNQTAVALYKQGGVLKEDARTLQKQDVDSDALPYLNEEVLTKMGIPTFGRRCKILKAAHALLSGTSGLVPAANMLSPSPPAAAANMRASNSFSATQPISSQQRRPSPSPSPSPSSSYDAYSPEVAGAPEDDDAGEEDTDEDIYEQMEEADMERAREREHMGEKASGTGGGDDDDGLFGTEEAAKGDSFMAVKPWIGAIKEPSNPPKFNPSPPSRQLKIDWVHGYRGFDSRSNLVYNEEGHVVYPTAGLVVVYDPSRKNQRYFQGHNDDVRCLAQHPHNKNLMVSGQNASIVDRRSQPPYICVWDASQPEEAGYTLKGEQADRTIRAVAFMGDQGQYVVSVSNDDYHHVKIWDWKKGKMLAKGKSDPSAVFGVRVNPANPMEFMTIGTKHLMHWSWDGSAKLRGKKVSAGSKPTTFYAVAYNERGMAIAGAADGNGYLLKGGSVTKTVPLHPKGKVLSLEPLGDGWVSGGSDKTVRVWNAKLQQTIAHTMSEHVTAVWPSTSGSDLLVGTRAGDVFELRDFTRLDALHGDADLDAVTRGHADGELWALGVVSGGKNFVTAGEDNTICLWDVHKHKMLKRAIISDKKGKAPLIKKASTTSKHPTNQCARACAVTPDKRCIILGTNDGQVAVFDTRTLQRKYLVNLNEYGKRQVKNQVGNWIEAISFSPSGRTCAVGTHGSVVCLLDPADGYKCKGVLNKSSSAITALDWSEDSSFIQTVDLGYELLFYSIDEDNLKNSSQVTSATSMKDVIWSTHTCKLGWPVQGIFDPSQKGSDINTVDVNPSKTLVVTGDDNGEVKLFRYPALEGAKSNRYGGHSSHVVTTRFTPDERFVISTGGHDLSIIQWALTD